MTQRRATPICVRCQINPTESVRYDTCDACWGDAIRAINCTTGGPFAEYVRTFSQ